VTNGSIKVEAKPNTGSETRKATITVSATGLPDQVISVTQTGSGFLNVSTTSLLYNPTGSTQTISVSSTADWTAEEEEAEEQEP
jgi:hypothetical protein